jgi:hypothetical protein
VTLTNRSLARSFLLTDVGWHFGSNLAQTAKRQNQINQGLSRARNLFFFSLSLSLLGRWLNKERWQLLSRPVDVHVRAPASIPVKCKLLSRSFVSLLFLKEKK